MNQSKYKQEISIEVDDTATKFGQSTSKIYELEVYKSEILVENIIHSKKKLCNNSNSSQAIKTFCRIRPIEAKNEIFKTKENTDDKTLLVNCDPIMLKKLSSVPIFTFSKVFDENSTQTEVFEQTCQILVEDLIKKRKPGLIFTYGMTNAGKTFTVIGCPSSPGILPQSLKYLYDKVENNIDGEGDFSVDCNFVEIYNEEVYDLLANSTDPKNKYYKKKINIKENSRKLFFLQDVTYHKIANLEDFNNALNKGISKKVHAATNLNQNSSRSHTIFKIILKPNNQDEEEVSLSIVDLAGSERANRTEAQGKELQEACKINQSLSVLGKCMEALRFNSIYNNKKLVPFRESKLTMLFQEYFQGDQNVIMVTNINPRREDFEETIRALNYSCIAKEIKPIKSKIIVNPIRKQVKILNTINNVDNLVKENEASVIDKENITIYAGCMSKSNSDLGITSVNSNEVMFLKSELEKLKEEVLKLTSTSNVCQRSTQLNSNNNVNIELQNNPQQYINNLTQSMHMMQMMNMTQSHILNENQTTKPFYNPFYLPFMFPPNSLITQLMNQNNSNSINNMTTNNPHSQLLDLELIPPNMNSFNLVFINSKFNDIQMGPKKKTNNNSRRNKKESSLPLNEEIRPLAEIKEIIPETVQSFEEIIFEDVEEIKNNNALETERNTNYDLDYSHEHDVREEGVEILDDSNAIKGLCVEEDNVIDAEQTVEIVRKIDNVKKAKKKKIKNEDEGEKKEDKEVKKKKKKPKKNREELKFKDENPEIDAGYQDILACESVDSLNENNES